MLTHRTSSLTSPARVVVLGARGFVASNLIGRLAGAGIAVRPVPASEIDLTQPSAVAGLVSLLREDDAVVFVSALTPDRGKDIATLMRNLQMGQHVAAALAARPVAHVVNVGSDAVYDDNANPVREASSAQPASFHGTMHYARERMLVETLRAAKTPLALLRPSLLYGPGDTHNGYGPNRFARTAAAGGTIALFGGGEEKRDHVYIEDVSALIALVLGHRSEGILNIASGEAHSFREVADEAIKLAGSAAVVQPSPRANPITHRHFDISALIAAFPQFRFTPLREGLKRTLDAVAVAG